MIRPMSTREREGEEKVVNRLMSRDDVYRFWGWARKGEQERKEWPNCPIKPTLIHRTALECVRRTFSDLAGRCRSKGRIL